MIVEWGPRVMVNRMYNDMHNYGRWDPPKIYKSGQYTIYNFKLLFNILLNQDYLEISDEMNELYSEFKFKRPQKITSIEVITQSSLNPRVMRVYNSDTVSTISWWEFRYKFNEDFIINIFVNDSQFKTEKLIAVIH